MPKSNDKRVAILTKIKDNKIAKLEEKIVKLEELAKNTSEDSVELPKIEAKIHRCQDKIRLIISHYEYNILPKEVRTEKTHELLVYKVNSLGFNLTLLTAALEMFYLVNLLNNMERNYLSGFTVITNIVILLFLFTAALTIKVYSKFFTDIILGYGVYMFIRIPVVHFILNVELNQVKFSLAAIIVVTSLVSAMLCFITAKDSHSKIKSRNEQINSGKVSFKQLSK